ncbi:MAG: DNA-directed RNA polymerase subunit alpha [Puniceicoccales bacterium]|jgi:DNA-directed RNA polymerase subunit alpha|nr:DNA-directed RNA polymerase subunit alpha [Puniceicoccales bacterium]
MVRRLGKFGLPKKMVRVGETATDTYGMFIAEPFESGYGHSIGNSLRRVLLCSIEAVAISSVKIAGVSHEFQSIPGVVEDVADIVLNLKKVLLKSDLRNTIQLTIDVEREGVVQAAEIKATVPLEIVNPEQVICTLNEKRRLLIEMEAEVGRGYALADDRKFTTEIGVIPIDALYSPVKLARYSVEDTRVGQMTDFDKLILEIWTDGRVTPENALKDSIAILKRHLDVFDSINSEIVEFEDGVRQASDAQNRLRILLNMSVNEIELSVRAANCLNNANITTVGELVMKDENDMLKYRNFGKKSLTEIKNKLEELGLSLGMKVDEHMLSY